MWSHDLSSLICPIPIGIPWDSETSWTSTMHILICVAVLIVCAALPRRPSFPSHLSHRRELCTRRKTTHGFPSTGFGQTHTDKSLWFLPYIQYVVFFFSLKLQLCEFCRSSKILRWKNANLSKPWSHKFQLQRQWQCTTVWKEKEVRRKPLESIIWSLNILILSKSIKHDQAISVVQTSKWPTRNATGLPWCFNRLTNIELEQFALATHAETHTVSTFWNTPLTHLLAPDVKHTVDCLLGHLRIISWWPSWTERSFDKHTVHKYTKRYKISSNLLDLGVSIVQSQIAAFSKASLLAPHRRLYLSAQNLHMPGTTRSQSQQRISKLNSIQ